MKEKLHLSSGHHIFFSIWSIFVAIALFVFIVSLSIKTTFLSPQYYKDNLKKVDAYNRIVNDGIPSLVFQIQISDDQLTDSLAKEVTTMLIQKMVDPSWVETMINTGINKTVVFLENPDQSINIDLSDFNKSLEKLSKSLLVAEEFIPGCKELTSVKASTNKTVAKAVGLLPRALDCTDSSEGLDEIKKDIGGIRQKIEMVNVGTVQMDQIVRDTNSILHAIRLFIDQVHMYFWISLISLSILILGFFVMMHKNLLGAFESLSIVGSVSALVGLLISYVVQMVTPRTLGAPGIPFSTVMQSITDDVVSSMISGFFTYIQVCMLIVLVLSMTLYSIVMLTKTVHQAHTRK